MNMGVNPLVEFLDAILIVEYILDQVINRIIIGLKLILDDSEVLVPILIITLLLSTPVRRDQTGITWCCWSWWLSTHPRIGRILSLQFWRFGTTSICRPSRTWPIESTLLISINTLIKGAHVAATTVLPSWHLVVIWFSSKGRAHQRFPPQHDFICAQDGANEIVEGRLNSLLILFQHIIMQFDSRLKLCNRLCIIFCVSLQRYHVLFESLD